MYEMSQVEFNADLDLLLKYGSESDIFEQHGFWSKPGIKCGFGFYGLWFCGLLMSMGY